MDQVKVALAMIKKHGFWILIVVVVLLGVGAWFTAASALAARYEARKSALDQQYTTVNGIKSESTGESASHPNEETIASWLDRVLANRVEALAAWKLMYKDQKERNQWPATLSPAFHRDIKIVEEQDRPIPNVHLEEYQTFINQHFPAIDKIIDRRKPKEIEGGRPGAMGMAMGMGMGMGMGGSGMGDMYGEDAGYMGADEGSGEDGYGGGSGGYGTMMAGAEMEGIVEWNDSDYARILKGVYWVNRPTSIEVRLAQEDLWVYEALLRSIALTNEQVEATNYFNAAVKRIEALEIGQPAAAAMLSAKSRFGLGGATGGSGGGMYGEEMGEDYGDEMGGGMMGSGMMGSGMMGSGMMGGEDMYGEGSGMGGGMGGAPTEEQIAANLLTGRYVDLTGEPQAADSEPYAEFRLMPVHIAVLMDQQKLPDFLVNLANCEMPVDVKQVSIQADGNANFASAGGGYGGDMMDDYGGGMMGGSGGGMMGGSGGGMMDDYGGGSMMGGSEEGYGGDAMGYAGGGTATASDEAKQDVPIEIFGVIRIFNPPDMEKLGTGSATDESSEGPTAALPPADAPTMVQPATPEPGPAPGSEPTATPTPTPAPAPTPTPTPSPAPSSGPAPTGGQTG